MAIFINSLRWVGWEARKGSVQNFALRECPPAGSLGDGTLVLAEGQKVVFLVSPDCLRVLCEQFWGRAVRALCDLTGPERSFLCLESLIAQETAPRKRLKSTYVDLSF